ncbi:MAG: hypothetical protein R3A44_23095 [Caldilineaceae bacterium]
MKIPNALANQYVRCLSNKRFLFFKDEPHREEELASLIVGKVYKLAAPEANDGDQLRVIDESGEDYLYPASYFEPLTIQDEQASEVVTAHVPAWLKGVLYAEAVAANKPVSALLREWLEDHLDLPTPA